MRITGVDAFLLSSPLPSPLRLPYYGGVRTIVKRDAMLVRVQTDEGITGYAPGPASETARHAIESKIAPFLTGKALGDPDALRVQFLQGARQHPDLLRTYCAVEIALYDARGKQLGVPVSELLGGRVRDRIRLYASAGMYMPPDGYAEEVLAVRQQGFSAYKFCPAAGPEKDLEIVARVRSAAGPLMDLMVDAHSWWRMGDASYDEVTVIHLAREMSVFEISWLEEPLPPHDHEAYRELRRYEYVPIAAGEHEREEAGFADLISSACVDVIQFDVACQGGYWLGRRLLANAARQGFGFAFHCYGTDLELIAAAHLGICWPEMVAGWLEYPLYSSAGRPGIYPHPLAREILRAPLRIEEGHLVVPPGPGLGVEVEEEVIQRYPWVPGPWSFFHFDSPAETWAVAGDHNLLWHGDAGL